MITITSLKHPTMKEKLIKALDLSMVGRGEEMNGCGNVCYVQNRKGHNAVRVSWYADRNDWVIYGASSGDITDDVLTVIFL